VSEKNETNVSYTPTRKPVFTETGQIGIVVRDLDATLRRYAEDFGIGPWTIFEVTPENAPNLRHDGEPIKAATRSAVAMIGSVMWEVTQPLDEHGIFARFLREKGEGVHHIAVHTNDFEGVVGEQIARGRQLPLSGSFMDIDVAYLPTDRDLGVIIETFSGVPSEGLEAEATGDA
jgi:methylmalonyl-CoA/ethylmalonyl-CoA epimerase